jgi:hypothetical protein
VQRSLKRIETLRALLQAGDCFRREFRAEGDDKVVIAERAGGRLHLLLWQIESLHAAMNEFDAAL